MEWIILQEMDNTRVKRFNDFLDNESARLWKLRNRYDQEEFMQRARQTEIIKRVFNDLLNNRPTDVEGDRRADTRKLACVVTAEEM